MRTTAHAPSLPQHVHDYLIQDRGLSSSIVHEKQLGWNGERITIPILNRDGGLAYTKLAKAPDDQSDAPKMLLPPGARAELYGWDNLHPPAESVVIVEGEYDRLVLESRGIAAVTSTAGVRVFRREWAPHFARIPAIFVCFDRDEAGQRGAEYVASLIPHARIVELPEEVGQGGDITDFFVRLGRTEDEFRALLDQARPHPAARLSRRATPSQMSGRHSDIDRFKELVPIESVVVRYVDLRQRGAKLLGRCPFHNDRTPSFYVYPPTHYHCFGCEAHGDVITFLRRHRDMSFGDAVDYLRRLAAGL